MPGWQEVVEARRMGQAIGQWQAEDGHVYVLPLHTSPVLWAWRTDLLGDLGNASLPRTYDEVVAVGNEIRATRPESYVWSLSTLRRDVWWGQWFDFLSLYYAASGGQPLVAGSEITADDDAAVEALAFLRELQADGLLHTEEAADTLETGGSICGPVVPLTTRAWRYRFPEMQMGMTYSLDVPPVPASYPVGEPVHVVAESRGVAIYAQSSTRERAAMWEFVRWVFSNPEHDLIWLQHTGLLPVRDDLMTNELFRAYLDDHPQLVPYAEALPHAALSIDHPNYARIQAALGEEAVMPVIRGEKEPAEAWQDWKDAVQNLL
jgi:multiple sugar transport system substrate-binding protein